jgi:steroid delta-isomerase-like uncharacterized protein
MDRQQVQDTVVARVEAFNTHDPDAVAAFYIEDAVSRDMGRDMALMGRAAIRESLATYFDAFPDVVMGISRIGVDGDTAFVEWHAAGTHREPYHGIPATGQHVEVDGCIVFNFAADGKITSEISYWDVASLLRQLGLMPAWPAEGAARR